MAVDSAHSRQPSSHHSSHHSSRRSPVVRLVGLVAAQALAVAALLAASTRPPVAGAPWVHGFTRWFAGAVPVDAVAVVTHRVAIVVATWFLATTVLHLAAALTRVPALVRATAWAALPGARRAVAAVVVTAGVFAPTAARAATGDPASVPPAVRDGRAVATSHARPAPGPVSAPVVATTPMHSTPPATPPAGAPPGTIGAPTTVVVQAGDSLWSIAARVVAAERGRPADAIPTADVAERWAAIRDANTGRLRSGDESVIYPGEEVVVPG
jgi:hypothetical protein